MRGGVNLVLLHAWGLSWLGVMQFKTQTLLASAESCGMYIQGHC